MKAAAYLNGEDLVLVVEFTLALFSTRSSTMGRLPNADASQRGDAPSMDSPSKFTVAV